MRGETDSACAQNQQASQRDFRLEQFARRAPAPAQSDHKKKPGSGRAHAINALCDAAQLAWDRASRRARTVAFEWRGRRYRSEVTTFRMLVFSASGEPICELA